MYNTEHNNIYPPNNRDFGTAFSGKNSHRKLQRPLLFPERSTMRSEKGSSSKLSTPNELIISIPFTIYYYL